MALKFIFYIFVLMNLRACVSGSSYDDVMMIPSEIWQSSWIIGVQWIAVVFGLIGNIALIAIFLKKDKSVRFNNLIPDLCPFINFGECIHIRNSFRKTVNAFNSPFILKKSESFNSSFI